MKEKSLLYKFFNLSLSIMLVIVSFVTYIVIEDNVVSASTDKTLMPKLIKNYGGTGDEKFIDGIKTNDGGYLTVGITGNPSEYTGYNTNGNLDTSNMIAALNDFTPDGSGNSRDILVTKLDSNLNEEWVNVVGVDDFNDEPIKVIEAEDGSFIVAGTYRNTSYLLKLDSSGSQEWLKELNSEESIVDIEYNSNNDSIVVLGDSYLNVKTDIFIYEYSLSGDIISGPYYYGSSGSDYAYDLYLSENSYLLLMVADENDNGFTWGNNIIKINTDYSINKIKPIDLTTGAPKIKIIDLHGDDGYVISQTVLSEGGGIGVNFSKLNNDLELEYTSQIGTHHLCDPGVNCTIISDKFDHLDFIDIYKKEDSGYLVVGSGFNVPNFENVNIYIAELDNSLNYVNSYVHGGSDEDQDYFIIPAGSGEYITGGYSQSTDYRYNNRGGKDATLTIWSPPITAEIEEPVIEASAVDEETGKVLVTINYPSEDIYKNYSLNGTDWLTYTGPFSVKPKKTIYAYSEDWSGHISPTVTKDVIDPNQTPDLIEEWLKDFNGPELNQTFYSVKETKDHGFLAVGDVDPSEGYVGGLIVKTDKDANFLWGLFTEPSGRFVHSIELADGGYLLFSETEGSGESISFKSIKKADSGLYEVNDEGIDTSLDFVEIGYRDIIMVKLNPEGIPQTINNIGTINIDEIDDISYDHISGEITVTWYELDPENMNSAPTQHIAKINSNGSIIWTNVVDSEVYIDDIIATGNNGEVIAVGYNNTSNLIMQFDKDGNLNWGKKIEELSYDNYIQSLVKDSEGNFYVVSDVSGAGGIVGISLTKLNSEGVTIWSKDQIEEGETIEITGLTLTNTGDILIAGQTEDLEFGYSGRVEPSGFVTKVSKDGKKLWTETYANMINDIIPYKGGEEFILAGSYNYKDDENPYGQIRNHSNAVLSKLVPRIIPTLDDATFTPSTTEPTEESINLTITYPDGATTKEYSFDNSTWEAYLSPLVITENKTVYARSSNEDTASNVSSIVISNINKTVTPPVDNGNTNPPPVDNGNSNPAPNTDNGNSNPPSSGGSTSSVITEPSKPVITEEKKEVEIILEDPKFVDSLPEEKLAEVIKKVEVVNNPKSTEQEKSTAVEEVKQILKVSVDSNNLRVVLLSYLNGLGNGIEVKGWRDKDGKFNKQAEREIKVETVNTKLKANRIDIVARSADGEVIKIAKDYINIIIGSEGSVIKVRNDKFNLNQLKLSSNWNKENIKIARVGKDGSYVTVPHHFNSNGDLVIHTRFPEGLVVLTSKVADFKDTSSTFSKNEINRLQELFIVEGTTDSTFEPQKILTRAQFSAMVARAFEYEPTTEDYELKDLSNNFWYADNAQALIEQKVLKGYPDKTFKGEKEITRNQAALMLVRLLEKNGVKLSIKRDIQFKDLKYIKDIESRQAILKLASARVIVNGKDILFEPNKPLTRAQMAKMLMKSLELTDLY